jgi:SAM-dependent methyltransferase
MVPCPVTRAKTSDRRGTLERVFSKTADVYDVLYAAKDYAAETARLLDVIRRRCPDVTSVLDVGCAIGLHAEHLARELDTVGVDVDVDEELVARARARVPGASFAVADAATMRLGRTFGAVVCLYDAIAYLVSASAWPPHCQRWRRTPSASCASSHGMAPR